MKRICPLNIDRLPIHQLNFKPDNENVIPTTLNKLNSKNIPRKPVKLPPIVDLRKNPNMPPVYDQGDLGSCTAQALGAAYEIVLPGLMCPSALFLYYNERVFINTVNIDSGALIQDGIKSLERHGVCPESEWPYIIEKFAIKPPNECYKSALSYKVLRAYNIRNTLPAMQGSLAAGVPFTVGILIYNSFMSKKTEKTGIVKMPLRTDKKIGGHAVLVVGYDNSKQWFIVRNSWGPSWGDAGYFYLPYAYLLNSKLSSNLWTVNSIT